MNSEYRSNSSYVSPRPPKPLRPLSPPEHAAAGDYLISPIEIYAMNSTLIRTTTLIESCSKVKSNSNYSCVGNNNLTENVVCVTDKDSSLIRYMPDINLTENTDDRNILTPESPTMENKWHCHISFDEEPPCKEHFPDTPRTTDHKTLADDETSSLEHAELIQVSMEGKEGIHSKDLHGDYTPETIIPSDDKISMFSKEIWTENVLPIDTHICPEPELVEIYFDKKNTSNQRKRFGEYRTESLDSPAKKNVNSCSVSPKNILMRSPLSGSKGISLLPGQKTINFNDEIWPICPKLIPTEKKPSMSFLETKNPGFPPEELNENEEKAAMVLPQSSPVKVANLFRVSSRSSTKQYDSDATSKIGKVIEPTHETEGQNDSASMSKSRRSCDTDDSSSSITQMNVAVTEQPHKFNITDRIFPEPSSSMNRLDGIENDSFCDEFRKSEISKVPRTTEQVAQVDSRKQEMGNSSQPSRTKVLKKNPLSVSSSEPVSTILRDILNRRNIDSSYEAKLLAMRRKKIISSDRMTEKHNTKSCNSNFHACRTTSAVKQVNFIPIKNHEIIENHFEETSPTRTDNIYQITQEMTKLSRSSTLKSENSMLENSIKFTLSNQDNYRQVHGPENLAKSSATLTSPKFSTTESEIVRQSNSKQEIEMNWKPRKVVRFETSGKCSSTEIDRIGTKPQKNIRPHRSRMHSDIDSTSYGHGYMSVERLKQEIGPVADPIAREIEVDPAADDVVITLAKIRVIVEANRKTIERLERLEPSVITPRLIPLDVGKSLAKALMRCKKYMQNSEYSQDAANALNKLLITRVQNLMQLVQRQKLVLAGRSKKRFAVSRGRCQAEKCHHENSSNAESVLTVEESEENQLQYMISEILTLTQKIVPKSNGKESRKQFPVASNNSYDITEIASKNRRRIVNAVPAKMNDTIPPEESKITFEGHASNLTQPYDVPESNKVKGSGNIGSVEPMLFSDVSLNPRIGSDHQIMQIRDYQKSNEGLETSQTPIMRSTNPKKIASTDSSKALKKLFNELWEKRSKPSQRHYNSNDSTSNYRYLGGSHNAKINQNLPVWKPAGNNFVQPSLSVIPINPKIRPPSSSFNKKRDTTNEQTKSIKPHQLTKASSNVIKHPSKTLRKKSIIKPHDTSSLANCKIRCIPVRGHHYEALCLDRNPVQVTADIEQVKTRKPRSKSRTRTKTSHNMSRVTITEIPLEHHTNDCSPVIEPQTPIVKKLSLTNKASSTPKEIIQMLEELIKSPDNETSFHNFPSVQVIGRCNVATKDLYQDIDSSELSMTVVKSMNATNFITCNHKIDQPSQDTSQNQSIKSKSIGDIITKSAITIKMDKDIGTTVGKCNDLLQEASATPCYLNKELDSVPSLSTEGIFTVSKSSSDTTSNHSMEGQNALSVLNVGCTAEISSENSIASVFSECCQVSLTSLSNHEISDELMSIQISDTKVTPCCKETQKDSDESFDTAEDDEVARDNFVQQLNHDRSISANTVVTPRKKFINKHARSLRMLKEILSDQGLGIHLLDRAQNELRDKCKCSSCQKALINRLSVSDKNLSTSLFTKLATLSESESDIERLEATTITLVNNSSMSTNDVATSTKSDSLGSRHDKALSANVDTVENGTQFDIALKSGMCVRDGITCDMYLPCNFQNDENSEKNLDSQHNSQELPISSGPPHRTLFIDGSEYFDCKLPDKILDAFQLAAVRATNFHAAVHILGKNVPSTIIGGSNTSANPDLNKIITHKPNSRYLSVSEESPVDDVKMGSVRVRNLDRIFVGDGEIESVQVKKSYAQAAALVTIITPRIHAKVNDGGNRSAPIGIGFKRLLRQKVTKKNETSVEKSTEKISDESPHACEPGRVTLSEPIVPQEPHLITSIEVSDPTIKNRTITKEQVTDPKQLLIMEPGFPRNAEFPRREGLARKTGSQSLSSSQQSVSEGCTTGDRIQTLHFAGKRNNFVVENTTRIRLININESKPQSSNEKVSSGKNGLQRNKEPILGSRIKMLLEENLQRFGSDYPPIFHRKASTDLGDQASDDSSRDELLISDTFSGTPPSTPRIHVNENTTFSEVNNIVNFRLNKVQENCELSTMLEKNDLTFRALRQRRLNKHVRRRRFEKIENTIGSSIPCGKYRNNLSGTTIPTERVLFLIYAIICSFVFCCLQLSVHCEA